jgi:1-acyl-sn-glycerol-3-phosphate acyltransferase
MAQLPPTASAEEMARLEGFDAGAGSRLRGFVALPLVLLATLLYLVAHAPFVLLAPDWVAARRRASLRSWGRTLLWIVGIRLEVHGAEHLPDEGPALVLFTHQSLVDLALISALWPARGTVVYKREFHAIPLMGRTMRAMGMTPIDRSQREAAVRSLDEVVRAMNERDTVAMLAPEGTRSRLNGLMPFKRGPFHVALDTGAPLIPMVFRGVRQVMPFGRWIARPGTVRVDYLSPTDTREWSAETLDQHIDDVRARFLELVPDGTTPAD